MHNREPLATAADKRQKNGQTALLIAALGGTVAIVSLFLTKHIGWWGVLGGFGIVVVAIILAAIMVDPYEKRFYKAYYNEYLYPELSSVTDDAKIELPNGFTKKELRDMKIISSLRKHVSRCELVCTIRGKSVRSSHLLYEKSRTVGKKSKLSKEAVPSMQAQIITLTDLDVTAPDMIIRPRGIYATEGVRFKNKRPEMLLVGAGTEALEARYEVLSKEIDATADFLTDDFCDKLLQLRNIVRFMSPNSGIFIDLRGNTCHIMISNWDNGCMPTMKSTMSSAYFEKCAVYTTALLDSCVRLFEPDKEFTFKPEVEL